MLDAWNKRHHPNMCFVFYEDLKKDLRGQVERIAKFLGKDISAENVEKLAEHLRFDNFKKNGTVNNEIGKELGFMKPNGDFIRKGDNLVLFLHSFTNPNKYMQVKLETGKTTSLRSSTIASTSGCVPI